jgi:hypothetical protein
MLLFPGYEVETIQPTAPSLYRLPPDYATSVPPLNKYGMPKNYTRKEKHKQLVLSSHNQSTSVCKSQQVSMLNMTTYCYVIGGFWANISELMPSIPGN